LEGPRSSQREFVFLFHVEVQLDLGFFTCHPVRALGFSSLDILVIQHDPMAEINVDPPQARSLVCATEYGGRVP
jgi:hypothetical protein